MRRFWQWCDAASAEVLNNVATAAQEIEKQWHREAAAANLRAKPYALAAGWLSIGVGLTAAALAITALGTGSVLQWVMASILAVAASAALVYRRVARDRLAVGLRRITSG